MYVVGIVLARLAINKGYEPSLLLLMGLGVIIVNLPMSGALDQFIQGKVPTVGAIQWLCKAGIESSEMMPLSLFIGTGAMINLGPLLNQPFYSPFDTAAQFGIFTVVFVVALFGFGLKDMVSIDVIGTADGPTSVLVSQMLNPVYIGPIAVTVYSYMAPVSIIQSFTIGLVATKKERRIRVSYNAKVIPKFTRIASPIVVIMIVGLISLQSVALVDFLVFGNLLHEYGVLNTPSQTAQNQLVNLITFPPGIIISFNIRARQLVDLQTLMILVLGLVALVFNTMAGMLFVKSVNMVFAILHESLINPMIGGCGTSAFPMSSHAMQGLANEEQEGSIILMQAVGTNIAGQVVSVTVGGLAISVVFQYLQRKEEEKKMNTTEVVLEIMGKGMSGLFVVAIVMILVVVLLRRLIRR